MKKTRSARGWRRPRSVAAGTVNDTMSALLTIGQVLTAQARIQPDALAARDLDRSMTWRDWNARSCRLANALLGLGLRKGDRVAVLAYNCVEWAETYAATAKAGLVVVPIALPAPST